MSKITATVNASDTQHAQNYIILLSQDFSKYGMSVIWIIGNFGSFFSCLIFLQPGLRNNPCVTYFLASSASQLLTFDFALLTRIVHYGFDVPSLDTVLWYCKIRFYLFHIFIAAPRYHIVMASIDRYFASCADIRWRRWSSTKIAKRCILYSFIFWIFSYIPVLIFYNIQGGDCSYEIGIYAVLFGIYLAIESGMIPPMLMLLFGLLTIRNIRLSKQTIHPQPSTHATGTAQTTRLSRKDLQLTKMLFGQIILWIILNIPYPSYQLYRSITIDDPTSELRTSIESFVSSVANCFLYLGFSLTFFVYTLSSLLFRNELKRIIQKRIFFHPRNVDQRPHT